MLLTRRKMRGEVTRSLLTMSSSGASRRSWSIAEDGGFRYATVDLLITKVSHGLKRARLRCVDAENDVICCFAHSNGSIVDSPVRSRSYITLKAHT